MSDQKKCCCTKNPKSKTRCNKGAFTRYKHFCVDHQGNCKHISDDRECQYLTKFIPKFLNLYLPTSPYTQSETVIGSGTYGQVRELKSPNDNQIVKTIKRNPSKKDYITSDVLAELSACQLTSGLKNLSSCLNFGFYDPDNVVKIYYDKYDTNGYVFFKDLYNADPYNFDRKHFLMYQLAVGLMELHSRYIAHLDLKPSNLLVKNGPIDQLAITDFGLSAEIYPSFKYAKNTQSKSVQTIDYRAPEVAIGLPYDQKADIWSMGLIFFEMLCNTNKPLLHSNTIPYKDDRKDARDYYFLLHVFNIFGLPTVWEEAYMAPNDDPYSYTPLHITKFKKSGSIPLSMKDLIGSRMTISRSDYVNLSDQLYDDITDLLSKMLVIDPQKRYDIQNVLMHPFFNKYTSPIDSPITRLIKTTPVSRIMERDILPFSTNIMNWNKTNPDIDGFEFGGLLSDFVQSIKGYFGHEIYINFLFYTSKLFEIVLSLMDLSEYQNKPRLALYACFHLYLKLHKHKYRDATEITFGFRIGHPVQMFTMSELLEMEKSIVIALEGNLWIPNELSYLKVLINDLNLDQTRITDIIRMLAFMKFTLNNGMYNEAVVMDELTKVKSCLDYYKLLSDDTLPDEVKNYAKHCGNIIDSTFSQPLSTFENFVKNTVDHLYVL